jgi:hypothetical protein
MEYFRLGKSRVIIPKKFSVDPRKMALAITNTLNSTALEYQGDFEVTPQTWSDKPVFAVASPTLYTRAIGTDDAIYTMLNKGTRPHIIRPKGGGVLVFRTPFRVQDPATLDRVAGRSEGAEPGDHAKPVNHPGTAPRQWDTTIAAQVASASSFQNRDAAGDRCSRSLTCSPSRRRRSSGRRRKTARAPWARAEGFVLDIWPDRVEAAALFPPDRPTWSSATPRCCSCC